jgi:hypothetical protein
MSVFVHAGEGGGQKMAKSVNVVVECPLIELRKSVLKFGFSEKATQF